MENYIGAKIIKATPMTKGAYNEVRGWTLGDGENPAESGYLVKYSDNYISWSPKEIFEIAYRKLTFDEISLLSGV